MPFSVPSLGGGYMMPWPSPSPCQCQVAWLQGLAAGVLAARPATTSSMPHPTPKGRGNRLCCQGGEREGLNHGYYMGAGYPLPREFQQSMLLTLITTMVCRGGEPKPF